MHAHIRLVTIGLLLLALPTLSLAQVATPTISPAGGGTTPNPAAIALAPSSFFGITGGKRNVETQDSAGNVIAKGPASNVQGELRAVGDTYAAALDYGANRIGLDPTPSVDFGTHIDDHVQNGGLAVQFDHSIALGVGVERGRTQSTSRIGLPLVPAVILAQEDRRSTMPVVGLVLRFADVLYLGTSYGKEHIHSDQAVMIGATPGAATIDVKRNVFRYGVALMWLDRDGSAFRLEMAGERRDPYSGQDPFSGLTTPDQDKRTTSGGELEWRIGRLLLGYYGRTTETSNGGVKQQTEKQSGLSLGWVPPVGWAVTVSSFNDRIDFSGPINGRHEVNLVLLGVHRQF